MRVKLARHLLHLRLLLHQLMLLPLQRQLRMLLHLHHLLLLLLHMRLLRQCLRLLRQRSRRDTNWQWRVQRCVQRQRRRRHPWCCLRCLLSLLLCPFSHCLFVPPRLHAVGWMRR